MTIVQAGSGAGRTRRWIRPAVVTAVVLLALGWWRRDAGARAPTAGITARVRRGDLALTVKCSGAIRARDFNKIMPQIKRGSEITFLVPDGSRVERDQVVATFNSTEVERKIKDIEAALSESRTRLATAESELAVQEMDNTVALRAAEQALTKARLEREKFLNGDAPLDRRNAELKARTAAGDLERRERRHIELGGLLQEGFVTEDEVEEERLAVETARVALETATIEQRVMADYSLPLQQATCENALAAAQTEREKAVKQAEARLRVKQQAVEAARFALARNEEDLLLLQKDLEACTVRAPADGTVMYGDPDQSWWRRGEIQVGSSFSPGQVLMTIPDMSAMEASVSVTESDIQRMRTNLPVTLTVEALPDRVFTGQVVRVAEVASADSWWASDVKEFKAVVTIADGRDLKPGFSCTAEIVTDTLRDALHVPVGAVFREGRRQIVYPAGGRAPRTVQVGRSSTAYAEILAGVEAGQELLLTPPVASGGEPGGRTRP